MRPSSIVGIILAAGGGSRMGDVKQLLPFKGRPILEIVVHTALGAGLDPVIVVLGHAADTIRRQVDFKNARIVDNPGHRHGQSTSLKAGLAAIPDHCTAAMFLLGDQPLVDRATVSLLADAYRQHRPLLVVPEYKGRRGNPVIIDRKLFPDIERLTGDTGARNLIKENPEQTLRVALDTDAIHFDVDRPEDYEQLQALENQTPKKPSSSQQRQDKPCD